MVFNKDNYVLGGGGADKYNVNLTVTDNKGSQDSEAKEVNLTSVPFCAVNQAPSASGLSVSSGDYCVTPSHYFSWTYSDPDVNAESQFQLQVDNNGNFSSPEVNRTFSGLSYPSGTKNSQVVLVSLSIGADKLLFNTAYSWRVKVWDSEGAGSNWVAGPNFSTAQHQYPQVNFNFYPSSPAVSEIVQFQDKSKVFGGASISAWSWSFAGGVPASSASQNPQVSFSSKGNKTIVLTVSDSSGYSCSSEQQLRVGFPLPRWREVSP